jgi:sugar phosphate isomerase/epimerase
MNLSLSNLCWDFESIDAYELLKGNNIEFIELSLMKIFHDWDFIDKKKKKKKKKQLSDYGLRVSSLQSIFYKKPLNMFNDSKEFSDHFKSVIEHSVDLGCQYIVYGSPRTRTLNDLEIDRAEDRFIQIFDELSDFNKDVLLGIEPNPEYYNCYFLNTHEKIKHSLGKLNRDNVVFHYDLACISLSGDDPHKIYLQELDNLRHVHISCKDLKSINNDEQANKFVTKIIQKNSCTYSLEMLNLSKEEITNCIGKIREWRNDGV